MAVRGQTIKKRAGRPRKNSPDAIKPVEKKKIAELSEKGVHQRDIARIVGCSQQNISDILRKVKEQENQIKEFNNKESDIWDYQRAMILNNLSDEIIRKVVNNVDSPRDYKDLMTGAGISYDKSALKKGKATQIFSIEEHKTGIDELQALQNELKELVQDDDGVYKTPQDIVTDSHDNQED